MADPARDDGSLPYDKAVREWHEKRVDLWETTVETELADGGVGGFLAWGDPAFYDSTLRILEAVRTRGTFDFAVDVIPGISAIQALAARHGIPLTQVGRSLTVTTGRQLRHGWPEGATDVVVMLDAALLVPRARSRPVHLLGRLSRYRGRGPDLGDDRRMW